MKKRSKSDNYSTVIQSPEFVNIRRAVSQAVNDYGMISSGERVMIAVSGGKDSSLLAISLE
jgi:PP-loop superfamily ATP-utilizing enzyme